MQRAYKDAIANATNYTYTQQIAAFGQVEVRIFKKIEWKADLAFDSAFATIPKKLLDYYWIFVFQRYIILKVSYKGIVKLLISNLRLEKFMNYKIHD